MSTGPKLASETRVSESPPVVTASAGAMLRQARQARSIPIAELAASLKVAQRKLEALEADRYHELPDNTFARALAKTVCRLLKIDAEPVLALLPPAASDRLEERLQGLKTPFRDRPLHTLRTDWSTLKRPAIWAPLLFALAALAIYLLPKSRVDPKLPVHRAASAAVPAAAPAAEKRPELPLKTAPAVNVEQSDVPELLQLRATAPSWVEVRDASGTLLLQRLLQPGEAVGLNGSLPMALKVGNAASTQLSFRGQAIDLVPLARDNVARIDLK